MPDPTPEQIEEARRLSGGMTGDVWESMDKPSPCALRIARALAARDARIAELEARIRHLEGNKNVDMKWGL